MMNKIKSNIYRLLPVVVFCLAAWSCSGEEGASMPQLPEVPADPDALCTITPSAIEISYVDASETPLTRSATGEPLQKVTQTENLGHNFSVEATLEAAPQEAQTRAAVAMTTGAQYRIVVFDKTTKAILGNVVYRQGRTSVVSGNPIKLPAGTYRLFCYSFNSTSNIPAIGTNGDVTVNPGDDFMTYTVADFTVAPTDYANGKSIAISFTRQCTRLTIYVMASGYTNSIISAASMKVSLPNNAYNNSIWNGLTMNDNNSLTTLNPSANITKASADDTQVFCGPTTSNKYLIIPPCTSHTIRIENLKLTIDGKALTPPSDYLIWFFGATMTKGKSYLLTLSANDYYVPTLGEALIGSVRWASANLEQYGVGTNSLVSFASNPWSLGSRWNWGMRDAADDFNYLMTGYSWPEVTLNDANQDPCTAVGNNSYTWRLPKAAEFDYLINNKAKEGTRVLINSTVNTIEIGGWAPTSKAFVAIEGNQVLVLPVAGIRGSQDHSITQGYYWSSEDLTTTGIMGVIDANHLYFNGGLLSKNNSSRSYGMSLRCVKR